MNAWQMGLNYKMYILPNCNNQAQIGRMTVELDDHKLLYEDDEYVLDYPNYIISHFKIISTFPQNKLFSSVPTLFMNPLPDIIGRKTFSIQGRCLDKRDVRVFRHTESSALLSLFYKKKRTRLYKQCQGKQRRIQGEGGIAPLLKKGVCLVQLCTELQHYYS